MGRCLKWFKGGAAIKLWKSGMTKCWRRRRGVFDMNMDKPLHRKQAIEGPLPVSHCSVGASLCESRAASKI